MFDLPPPLRDDAGRSVWLAVWGDLFHRSAVYVKATTVADVHEVLRVQRAGSGPPRWVRPAGEATARQVLSRRRPNWLLQRVPVLE